MKFKSIAIILLTLTFLTGLRLVWLVVHQPPEQPHVEEGVLDLSSYIFPNKQSITLNGDWVFLHDRFAEIGQTPYLQHANFITVPGNEQIQKDAHYGTYHMRVVLPKDSDEVKQWGIKLPKMMTAYELYINNRLIDASGTVSENAQQHVGTGYSNTVYFFAENGKVDITLLVSNFDTAEGIGIAQSIHFGDASAISSEHAVNQVLTISLVVVLMLFGVFSVLVYLFIYKKKIVLLFTLGFLLPALDELTTFNPSLLQYLPLNYEWSMKFLNLVYLGAAFFFIQFMRILLVHYRNLKLFTYYSWLYLLCAVIIIVLPVSTLTNASTSFFILYGVSFLSVVVLALKEYISNTETSIFIAFTALCTTSGITWGAIKGILSLEIPFYPFDYLFGLIFFAAFWFKYFYQLKNESDELVITLQKMDSQRDAFLEESAEKLWSPLNEMITIGQTLYDTEVGLKSSSKENIKYGIDIGRSMTFVLDDIVNFTKLKDNRLVLEQGPLQVQKFIPAIFDMLEFMTKGKYIQMTSYIPKDFPKVYGDEKQVIQILFNILHNAVKYTSKGDIHIKSSIVGDFAQFEIQDTGIGIEQEVLATVLEPFFQLDEDDKGVGIGLSVAKQLVLLHGGTFDILSTLKEGTIIRFTLPLLDKLDANETEKQQNLISSYEIEKVNTFTPSTKTFSILVVDDDPVNLVVIEQIFTSNDSHIMTTNSSEDALQLIKKSEWDLVIIDAMMPIESGYSLTQIIRQQFTKLELPILLLTTRSGPIDVYTALALGANDYVTKPINSLELKIRGHALIDLKNSIRERSQMETALLQAQIQPHFLFNTLNSIAALSRIDTDRMVLLLRHFGQYLQSSFDTSNLNPVVPIQKELELVEAYLYIQKERFQDRLTVEWLIEEGVSFELPPLILQTLVENAVHHGLLNKIDGGTLSIKITEKKAFFYIEVQDDGVGMDEELVSTLLLASSYSTSGVGLRNSNRRLLELFNKGLHITSEVDKGTTVSFHIPK